MKCKMIDKRLALKWQVLSIKRKVNAAIIYKHASSHTLPVCYPANVPIKIPLNLLDLMA